MLPDRSTLEGQKIGRKSQNCTNSNAIFCGFFNEFFLSDFFKAARFARILKTDKEEGQNCKKVHQFCEVVQPFPLHFMIIDVVRISLQLYDF